MIWVDKNKKLGRKSQMRILFFQNNRFGSNTSYRFHDLARFAYYCSRKTSVNQLKTCKIFNLPFNQRMTFIPLESRKRETKLSVVYCTHRDGCERQQFGWRLQSKTRSASRPFSHQQTYHNFWLTGQFFFCSFDTIRQKSLNKLVDMWSKGCSFDTNSRSGHLTRMSFDAQNSSLNEFAYAVGRQKAPLTQWKSFKLPFFFHDFKFIRFESNETAYKSFSTTIGPPPSHHVHFLLKMLAKLLEIVFWGTNPIKWWESFSMSRPPRLRLIR